MAIAIASAVKVTNAMQNLSRLSDHTDRSAEWDFVGHEFPLPHDAGSGCMLVVPLAQGGNVYYSEYRVLKDCMVESSASPAALRDLLCTQVLLSGSISLETPSGDVQPQNTDHALLFRLMDTGSRIYLPGNQIVRHVGVAVPLSSSMLGGAVSPLLEPFRRAENDSLIVPVPLQKSSRKWAAELFLLAADRSPATVELQREGLARCFLSSLLSDYVASELSVRTVGNEPTAWEVKTCELVSAHIRENMSRPLNARTLAADFGMSRRRLNELFSLLHGHSVSGYVRHHRLLKAKQLIEHEGVPVKVAAFAIGYRHVSNFTRAYRQYFGRTPGCSQRQLGDSKTSV